MAMQPLRAGGVLNLEQSDLARRLRDDGMALAAGRDFWVIPPVDTLFLQRKIGGMFLLATRLRAQVDMDAVLRAIPPD